MNAGETVGLPILVRSSPQRVGSVVLDGNGDEWVRVHRGGGPAAWHRVAWDDDREPWSVWSAITPPTYLLPVGCEVCS